MGPSAPSFFVGFPLSIDESTLHSWRLAQPESPDLLAWFHHEDFHVTLAFLGPCSSLEQTKALEWIQHHPMPSLTLTLGFPVLLPDRRRFSALSFTINQGQSELVQRMKEHRDACLEWIGREKDPRSPFPHVTFARPKRHLSAAQQDEIRQWIRKVTWPEPSFTLQGPALFTRSPHRPAQWFKRVPAEGRLK